MKAGKKMVVVNGLIAGKTFRGARESKCCPLIRKKIPFTSYRQNMDAVESKELKLPFRKYSCDIAHRRLDSKMSKNAAGYTFIEDQSLIGQVNRLPPNSSARIRGVRSGIHSRFFSKYVNTNYRIQAIEIANGVTAHSTGGLSYPGADFKISLTSAEEFLDNCLKKGIYLHAIAAQFPGSDVGAGYKEKSVYTYIESTLKNQSVNDAILKSFHAGSFYASSGLELHSQKWIRFDPNHVGSGPRIILNSGENEVVWCYSMEATLRLGNHRQCFTHELGQLPVSKGRQVFEFGKWEDFKWIRFTAVDAKQHQKRAWCQAITGPQWVSIHAKSGDL